MGYLFNAGETFKISIQIEENGKRFYDESIKIIDDPEIKELFEELGRQEIGHKKLFENLYANLPADSKEATVWDPENEMDLYIKSMADSHIFTSRADVQKLIAGLKGTSDALNLAIQFEKESVLFYLGMLEVVVGRDQERVQQIVKEEQGHLRRLTLELKKFNGKIKS
jgi:rubrerythrin